MRTRRRLAFVAVLFIFLGGCDSPSRTPRTSKEIVYTKHARCRMDCRSISEAEVKEILATGHVNRRKSDPDDKPCPTEALEGRSADGQAIRVVVARCPDSDKIITVIDTEVNRDVNCDCR